MKHFKDKSETDFNTFYYQYPIENYLVDFAFPCIKLAIETDGNYWHGGYATKLTKRQAVQKIADLEKASKIMHVGWTVLRFKEQTVYSYPEEVKQEIKTAVLSMLKV